MNSNYKLFVKFLMLVWLSVIFITVQGREYMSEKPEFFKLCSYKDDNFSDCYKENLQALLWNFKDGIPGLPAAGKFEPVEIKKLNIALNQLKIKMKNISIQGLSATNITKVVLNPKSFSFFVKASLPAMRLDANYKTAGNILFFTLNGNGPMWLEMENADFTFVFKVKLRDESSLTFFDVQSVKSKVKNIGGFRVNLENLFNGNKELEANTNALFNENWQIVIEMLRPTLQDAIDAVLSKRFKRVFRYIPANYLISDMPSAMELYN